MEMIFFGMIKDVINSVGKRKDIFILGLNNHNNRNKIMDFNINDDRLLFSDMNKDIFSIKDLIEDKNYYFNKLSQYRKTLLTLHFKRNTIYKVYSHNRSCGKFYF